MCVRVRWRENEGERDRVLDGPIECQRDRVLDGEFERGGKSSETTEWCVRELWATSQGISVRTMSVPKISSLD